MINNKTTLNMVIGYPLAHSQSPMLHNHVYQHLQCNAVMLAQSNENLASLVQAIKTFSVGLVAVTMPFKQTILSYLDDVSDEVAILKAANTVIKRDGRLYGYNTDIDGIAYALRAITLNHKNVLIIGAGGAAKAAAYYLKTQGANLFWLNRTAQHALTLMDAFGGVLVDDRSINNLAIDIIINTTPQGMYPHLNCSPLPADYPFKEKQVVFDMVYNPIDTLLLQEARSQQAICISGLEMFIGQGLKQIELWLETSIINDKMISSIHSLLNTAQQKQCRESL